MTTSEIENDQNDLDQNDHVGTKVSKKIAQTFVNRNETAVTLQHVTSSGLKLLICDSKVTHLRQGSYSPAIGKLLTSDRDVGNMSSASGG